MASFCYFASQWANKGIIDLYVYFLEGEKFLVLVVVKNWWNKDKIKTFS